ncbi:MAG: class I SAM-dependent methyltransferase [Cyclobacteriaceae bacterium]
MVKDWFGQWFDSPYYHILYQNRDYKEASLFIDHLIDELHINESHHVMDLACGKGRHSIYLNQKGFHVTGLDLSRQNIEAAKTFENDRLSFHIHDMRDVFRVDAFDFVLNLFTSFGYFDNDADNMKSIDGMAKALKPGGSLVLDFLNPHVVIDQMVPEAIKTIGGIEFHITKSYRDGYILKDIIFEADGKQHHYQEKVRAITKDVFLNYFEKAGLDVVSSFGNYELDPYVSSQSDRMIFIAKNTVN